MEGNGRTGRLGGWREREWKPLQVTVGVSIWHLQSHWSKCHNPKQFGEQRVCSVFTSTSHSTIEESWYRNSDRNLEVGTRDQHGWTLLTGMPLRSPRLIGLFFNINQDHQPRVCTIHCRLHPCISVISQENAFPGLSTVQYNRDIFSVKIPSSQMMVGWITLTGKLARTSTS